MRQSVIGVELDGSLELGDSEQRLPHERFAPSHDNVGHGVEFVEGHGRARGLIDFLEEIAFGSVQRDHCFKSTQ